MTSDFGSEFGGSDAVFYGGPESRRSSMCCESDVEEGPLDWEDQEMVCDEPEDAAISDCDEDAAMSDCGDDIVAEWDPSESQSEDEELISDGEPEVEDADDGTTSPGEVCVCFGSSCGSISD